jgi:hypothetical protein
MSHFDDLLNIADPGFFEILGGACTYDDTAGSVVSTRVVIERNVETVSMYDTQMATLRNIANLLKSEIPDPKRGHIITEGSSVYVVDQLDSDDGHVVRVLLQ